MPRARTQLFPESQCTICSASYVTGQRHINSNETAEEHSTKSMARQASISRSFCIEWHFAVMNFNFEYSYQVAKLQIRKLHPRLHTVIPFSSHTDWLFLARSAYLVILNVAFSCNAIFATSHVVPFSLSKFFLLHFATRFLTENIFFEIGHF